MTFVDKTISIGCAAAAITIGPKCLVLGIASNICNDKHSKHPLEDPWLLIATPILLSYASYSLWTKE